MCVGGGKKQSKLQASDCDGETFYKKEVRNRAGRKNAKWTQTITNSPGRFISGGANSVIASNILSFLAAPSLKLPPQLPRLQCPFAEFLFNKVSFKLLKGSIFNSSLALGVIENDFRTLYRGIFSDFSIYVSKNVVLTLSLSFCYVLEVLLSMILKILK